MALDESVKSDDGGEAEGETEGKSEKLFYRVRDEFLSSLSPEQRRLYSPCPSAQDLMKALEKLDTTARRTGRAQKWLLAVSHLLASLQPYFATVDAFASSNAGHASLALGALRLVLQLGGNYSAFFDKFTAMISQLAAAFPQYVEVVDYLQYFDKKAASVIRHQLGKVYRDLFEIFHAAVRIFTKADGRPKRANAIFGGLIWKPFNQRFEGILRQMREHQEELYRVILLQDAMASAHERAKATIERLHNATERELNQAERLDRAKERTVIEEMRIIRKRIQMKTSDDAMATLQFVEVSRVLVSKLEKERVITTASVISQWLSPPPFFEDAKKRALQSRQERTTAWMFDDPVYRKWIGEAGLRPTSRHQFGSNVLWICGHPGAGKTTLAASIIDNLSSGGGPDSVHKGEVYYYFFEYLHPESTAPIAMYRALLSQILLKHRHDKEILDQFSFIMGESEGQGVSSESALIDLLKLHLDRNPGAHVVVDGIDECTDTDVFLKSMLQLSGACPSLKLLFLSRVNVAGLKRAIPLEKQLEMPKEMVSRDIRHFFRAQLQDLFDEGTLPESAQGLMDRFVNQLVQGADGMFLWASLMVKFLRSGCMTPPQRVEIIGRVNVPEHLDKMYERIFSFIKSSGHTFERLASKIVSWLTNSIAPMSSPQLLQGLVVSNAFEVPIGETTVEQFEDMAIMACAGLVERCILQHSPEHPSGTSSLRFVHLSVNEILARYAMTSLRPAHIVGTNVNSQLLIPDVATAGFELANCCLRHLIKHVPPQPLSGAFNQRLSYTELQKKLRFTDYAAVYWLEHLRRGISAARKVRVRGSNLTAAYRDAVVDFALSLSTFLRSCQSVSVWLESFYTASNQRRARGILYPPTEPLADWVAWLAHIDRSEPGGLYELDARKHIRTVQEFGADLEQVVRVWGDRLDAAPEIVWDEMTGFIDSQFFFSPGSTKFYLQKPTQPIPATTSSNHVALISRTSYNANIKGVLSIWPPASLYCSDKRELRFPPDSQLYDVSTGWVALYEVWSLEQSDRRIAKIEIQLDPLEVMQPLSQVHVVLYSSCQQVPIKLLFFPLAISPDALCFTVLRRLFTVTLTETEANMEVEASFLSHVLPSTELCLTPLGPLPTIAGTSSYEVHFSENGLYLALLESLRSNEQKITVFAYCPRGQQLRIESTASTPLFFEPGYTPIKHITFHLSLTVLAFYTCFFARKGVELWQFRRNAQASSTTSRAPEHKYATFAAKPRCFYPQKYIAEDIEMQFSSCGLYLVVQASRSGASPSPWQGGSTVIPVPEHLTANHHIGDAERQQDPSGSDEISSLVARTAGLELQNLYQHGAANLTRSSYVNNALGGATYTVANDRGTVILSRTMTGTAASSDNQDVKLAALPPSLSQRGTTPVFVPPAHEGDTAKVVLDNTNEEGLHFLGDELCPVVVVRDSRFIKPSQLLSGWGVGYTERSRVTDAQGRE